ncbi:MAG: YHYH protein [Pseudomonadota bacterium]
MTLRSALIATALAVVHACKVSADPLTVEIAKDLFTDAQLVSDPIEVDCTLSGGAETRCIQLTFKPEPATYEAGPWCPKSVDDGPESSGIWFYEGEIVDADGAFFTRLSALYDDEGWQVFDPETGQIFYTATKEACELAARPNVAEEYQNHCVQCLLEFVDEGHTVTYAIPVEPIAADRPNDLRGIGAGVAFNGIRIDEPAPVKAILGAYTIAAFDDCAGHVNPAVGYHYHAVTDCLEGVEVHTHEDGQTHSHNANNVDGDPIGLALDGHFIFPHLNADGSEPEGLDTCFGHSSEELGYHYHAGVPGMNQNLGCLTAQVGCSAGEAGETCNAAATIRRGPPPPRD